MGDGRKAADGQHSPLQTLPNTPSFEKPQRHRPADIDTSAVYRKPPPPASLKQSNVRPTQKLSEPQENPLFPPLPNYDKSTTRTLKTMIHRPLAFSLTLCCLSLMIAGAMAAGAKVGIKRTLQRITFRDPDAGRPFLEEEKRLAEKRKKEEKEWNGKPDIENLAGLDYVPTEGGRDKCINDIGYYARRVGLDVEDFKVQTEDGFLIDLHHVYDPKEYIPLSATQRAARGPEIFTNEPPSRPLDYSQMLKPKFPILMIHGLMQAAGTFCSHDDKSLAFYLCKSGYDVWLGTNRCGFLPEHAFLKKTDPRMWSWTIRDMGTRDLPAFTSRVLSETGFEKLGLIGHSQGTTQTFIALSKDHRPDFGSKITVFCALAPAVYAGPLLKRWYFSFVTSLSPFRYAAVFGIHAFIPIMAPFRTLLPSGIYGTVAYRMFNYLFGWSDWNWDRGLRDRGFQCSPTYISSECMRWWLGSDGFAKNGCILASSEEAKAEIEADDEAEKYKTSSSHSSLQPSAKKDIRAWYDHRAPPMAFWAAGKDQLVDGRRLLKRFARGREPDVGIVHSELIEEYEHLDVIWAMNVVDKVGKEVRDVLWKTCDVRDKVRMPRGCEEVGVWENPRLNGEKNIFEDVD